MWGLSTICHMMGTGVLDPCTGAWVLWHGAGGRGSWGYGHGCIYPYPLSSYYALSLVDCALSAVRWCTSVLVRWCAAYKGIPVHRGKGQGARGKGIDTRDRHPGQDTPQVPEAKCQGGRGGRGVKCLRTRPISYICTDRQYPPILRNIPVNP